MYTITSEAILILGRFTPERKGTLDALRVSRSGQATCLPPAQEILGRLLRDFPAEILALNNEMAVVDPSVDTGSLHFLLELRHAVELVHRVSDRAAHNERDIRVCEVLL